MCYNKSKRLADLLKKGRIKMIAKKETTDNFERKLSVEDLSKIAENDEMINYIVDKVNEKISSVFKESNNKPAFGSMGRKVDNITTLPPQGHNDDIITQVTNLNILKIDYRDEKRWDNAFVANMMQVSGINEKLVSFENIFGDIPKEEIDELKFGDLSDINKSKGYFTKKYREEIKDIITHVVKASLYRDITNYISNHIPDEIIAKKEEEILNNLEENKDMREAFFAFSFSTKPYGRIKFRKKQFTNLAIQYLSERLQRLTDTEIVDIVSHIDKAYFHLLSDEMIANIRKRLLEVVRARHGGKTNIKKVRGRRNEFDEYASKIKEPRLEKIFLKKCKSETTKLEELMRAEEMLKRIALSNKT